MLKYSILGTSALVLSLAACGSSDDGTSSKKSDGGTNSGGSAGASGGSESGGSDSGGSDSGGSDSGGSDSGGSDSGGSSMGGAAGSDAGGSGGMQMGMGGTTPSEIQAVATVTPDYVGLPVLLDGGSSMGDDLEYSWDVISTPPGSGITGADLVDASAANASFVADRGGSYVLELTVTAGDETSVATVAVEVPVFGIPHLVARGNDSRAKYVPMIVSSDGSNRHAIGCHVQLPDDTPEDEWTEVSYVNRMTSASWMVAGEEKLVYMIAAGGLEGPPEGSTAFATSSTNCGGPEPTLLDGMVPVNPNFSPSGQRIAAGVTDFESTSGPGTVGATGEDPRLIDSSSSTPDVTWLDETTVVYAPDSSTLRSAPDEEDGGNSMVAQVILDCSGDGDMLSPRAPRFADGNMYAISDGALYRLESNLGVFDCASDALTNTILSNVDEEGSPTHEVEQFAVSPDGSRIAYLAFGEADGSSGIYTVLTDGTAEPELLVQSAATIDWGLHWVADGKQLVWSTTYSESDLASMGGSAGEPANPDRIARSVIFRINADGTHLTEVLREDSSPEEVIDLAIGGTQASCSFGVGGAGGASAIGGLLFAASALIRRRRRR